VYISLARWRVCRHCNYQEGAMPETKAPLRGEYRVVLDRLTVCKLRQRAARETLTKGGSVTWQEILRQASDQAAKEEVE
jgi:hypothetical protein